MTVTLTEPALEEPGDMTAMVKLPPLIDVMAPLILPAAKWGIEPSLAVMSEKGAAGLSCQSRLRKSAQDDKWSFCLTAGTLCPTNQERQ
ncbi:MAG: hypothetical protein ABSA90_09230 [Xanthobacteraceae bacterium]|jgi:hypothetical protein